MTRTYRVLPAAAFVAMTVFLGALAPAFAGDAGGSTDSPPREQSSGKSVGASIKDGAKAVGHATRDATKAIGHGTRDVVKAVGHGTHDAAKAVGHGFHEAWDDLTGK